jgi:hypothetical protein
MSDIEAVNTVPAEVKKSLAKAIMSSIYSLAHKSDMMQHLADGKPAVYVEAQLDWSNLFFRFAPAVSGKLPQFLESTGAVVVPRTEEITDEKAVRYMNIYRQLKTAGYEQRKRVKAFVNYNNGYGNKLCEIAWYDWFTDEVSLCVSKPDSYKIIPRKELFNGLEQARDAGEARNSEN